MIDERTVRHGVMYRLSAGCQCAALPRDLPPPSMVDNHPGHWDEDLTRDRIHLALDALCREQAGREASPTAATIDSQSGKAAKKGGLASPPQAGTRARRSKARSVTSC